MNNVVRARLGAILLSAALVIGVAPAAVADDSTATLQLSTPATLTLPAADGVRDSADVQLSSDVATTVALSVLAADGTTELVTLPSVELVDGALTAPVSVPVTGLPAGALTLVATPTAGAAVQVPLTVGSGAPASVSLAVSRTAIYTWTGSSMRTAVATVTAVDETGLTIPFTGSVVTTIGAVTRTAAVASTDGTAAAATISASGLPLGAATVVATATAQDVTASSAAAPLAVREVAVTSTSIATSLSTLYPARDGLRDSTKIVVTSTATNGATVPATGSVKITRSGKTVKSWALSSSKTWSATWDGKVAGKIVPGFYKISVAIKGPQGVTRTASKTVEIRVGWLETRTAKKTVNANTVLTGYYDYGDYDYNECWENYPGFGDVYCEGGDSYNGTFSVLGDGSVTIPSTVVAAQKYGSAKARITAKVSRLYNDAAWGYWLGGKETGRTTQITGLGSSTPGWMSLPATTRTLDVQLGIGEYSWAAIDTFTIEWSYQVLVTK